mmetsp:Transcript_14641/g.48039  ORF Transcript_14641/g.48039 Transcript_14641/m.48039 type:complete len:254 (+) Transcript_14641:2025-2786(+)
MASTTPANCAQMAASPALWHASHVMPSGASWYPGRQAPQSTMSGSYPVPHMLPGASVSLVLRYVLSPRCIITFPGQRSAEGSSQRYTRSMRQAVASDASRQERAESGNQNPGLMPNASPLLYEHSCSMHSSLMSPLESIPHSAHTRPSTLSQALQRSTEALFSRRCSGLHAVQSCVSGLKRSPGSQSATLASVVTVASSKKFGLGTKHVMLSMYVCPTRWPASRSVLKVASPRTMGASVPLTAKGAGVLVSWQ